MAKAGFAQSDFPSNLDDGGEVSINWIELTDGKYAIDVYSRSKGFNGAGTTDITTHSIHAIKDWEWVELFSFTANELFEGPTDGSGKDRVESRTLMVLPSKSNNLYDFSLRESEDAESEASTMKTYKWDDTKYVQRK